MTEYEIDLIAECAWKENRHGGKPGMQSVINVILNRQREHPFQTITEIIMAPEQFSSMSVKSDPEYHLDPEKGTGVDLDMWNAAIDLAQDAANGTLQDIVGGATLYYAPAAFTNNRDNPHHQIYTPKIFNLPDGRTIPFPEGWNVAKVKWAESVASQEFFLQV